MKKNCKYCIWFDDCDAHELCDNYYDGSMRDDIRDYKSELKDRAEAYSEVMSDICS